MSDIISRFTAAGAEEYTADLHKMADATEELATANKQVETSSKGLRAELRAITQQLAQMSLAGKENTVEYRKLRDEAGKLRDAMSDAAREIATAGSDTRGLDKAIRATNVLVGGFTAVQGAAALFGKEGENLQRTLLKVNAAMSLLNGLQAIQNELTQKDSILTAAAGKAKELYARFTTSASVATKVFTAALTGGLLLALGFLVTNYGKVVEWLGRYSDATRAAAKANELAQKAADLKNKALEYEIALMRARGVEEEKALLRESRAAKQELERLAKELADNKKLLNAAQTGTQRVIRDDVQIVVDPAAVKRAQGLVDATREKLRLAFLSATQANQKLREFLRAGAEEKEETEKTTEEIIAQAGSLAALEKRLAEAKVRMDTINPSSPKWKVAADEVKELTKQVADLREEFELYLTVNPEIQEAIKELGRIEATQAQETSDFKAKLGDQDLQASIDRKKAEAKANEEFNKQIRLQDTETFRQRSSKAQAAFEYAARFEQSLAQIVDNSYAIQLANLEEKRRKGLITEKEYAKQVAVIQQKQLKASKATGIIEATINGAVAALKAFAELGPIGGAIAAALIAGITATQIALIAKQKVPNVPGFFKGTKNAPPGMKWVGEEGPELVNDPGGYAIIPAGESQRIADMYKKWDVPTIQVPELIRPKPAYTPPSGERLNKIVVQKDNTEMLTELKFISQYIKQGNAAEWNNNNVLKGISAKITGRGFRT